jgi:hypothetical protein
MEKQKEAPYEIFLKIKTYLRAQHAYLDRFSQRGPNDIDKEQADEILDAIHDCRNNDIQTELESFYDMTCRYWELKD